MNKVVYQAPTGSEQVLQNLVELERIILDGFPHYWHDGHGGGILYWFDDEICTRQLLIHPNDNYGIYLQYIDKRVNTRSYKLWLSLHNSKLLGEETVEYADECYASVGLFLTVEKAWLAVEEFCRTGGRTDKIVWIEDTALPEYASY